MKKIFLFILLFSITIAKAQNAGDIDTGFSIGNSFRGSGIVRAIANQTDGKTIIGGTFYEFNGVAMNNIVRLNANGSIDSSFTIGSGFDSFVLAIYIQTDGKIIVGGTFTTYNGVTANRIVRLNSDGTLDSTFNMGIGFDNQVYAIAAQADGKILIGGNFTTYKGLVQTRMIRLNTDGTLDPALAIGSGFDNFVGSIVVLPTGGIVVGGNFLNYNGTLVNRIVLISPLDGSIALSGTGFDNSVRSMTVLVDGSIIIGGNFTSLAAVPEIGIVKLTPSGFIDTTFNSGTGFNGIVTSVVAQPDGKVVVGGSFTTYNGAAQNKITRLNSDGSIDPTFVSGIGCNDTVIALAIKSSGKIVAGGVFNFYNNNYVNAGIQININGTIDTTFNTGIGFLNGSAVLSIVQQTDGKILTGGDFKAYYNSPANRIVRLNTDGSKDTSFNLGTGFNNNVNNISLQIDAKILVGGAFTLYNMQDNKYFVRLNANGTNDTSFNTGTGFNNTVYVAKQQTDGRILVGGDFTTYNGVSAKRIVRLNIDGSIDTSFVTGSGFGQLVFGLTIQPDGKILVGGDFTSYKGVIARKLIRLNIDGSVDTTFNIGSGYTNRVAKILVQPDGKIITVGTFIFFNNLPAKFIVRLNADGTRDTTFAAGTTGIDANDIIDTAEFQADGKIIAAGYFTSFNNVLVNNIIRLNADGTTDGTFNSGAGCNSEVRSLAIQADRKILTGGAFYAYNNVFALRMVRLTGDSFLANDSFLKNSKFSLYPNPTKSQINLQFSNNVIADKVIITDLSGKIILEQTIKNNTVNTENLAVGMYFIQAFLGGEQFQSKFIKE
ncbi:MAG: T9SS type A sorting domain-containing protein [Flavobacterium sp.]|nr:T9SS type A sorting domain-containing protein [Flavobacterium sp.]